MSVRRPSLTRQALQLEGSNMKKIALCESVVSAQKKQNKDCTFLAVLPSYLPRRHNSIQAYPARLA